VKGRGWVALGLMVLVVLVLVLLRGNSSATSSPNHASSSDAADGTSALRLYADALGHSSGLIEGDFTLPSTAGLLFIFTPGAFTADEVQQVNTWVTAGGVLVYAAEDGDPQLDAQFGLGRSSRKVAASALAPAPVFGGVQSVSGADMARAFNPTPSQVPLLRNHGHDVLAVREAVGRGLVVAMSDPLVLCNGYLEKADNGRLAADLLALTPSGGRVWFDEFHHGAAATAPPETAWMTTPWGLALLCTVLILFTGLALRGRGFGPPIPLRPRADRSTAEYATAVGSLLHRTGARRVTLETLLSASRRAVAERIGLGSGVPSDRLTSTIAQRAPVAAAELATAERELDRASLGEPDVLATARRLHDLAYPMPTTVPHQETA
jgi:hypothetical protein